ncbi:GNAT family N-acetyltransferase [Thaumasiovibrio subtropicus]|uniref:GNAT family N-acetyltransferase n=1 Tax=Thaumasiovibrio subtropicus TaxID=1891207 RepID=UPI000B34ECA1|nr:GNAT family protein [Thaumasiovibrio subtropicus]
MHLETQRLRIRPTTHSDLPALYAYLSLEDVTPFLPGGVHSLDDVKVLIDKPYPHTFSITLLNGRLIGHLLFHPWFVKETYELGWVIAPKYQGKGYASEAARAAMDYGFSEMRLHRIIATAQPENPASWRVMEKIGMRKEAHSKQCLPQPDGTWWDEVFYALLREEWQPFQRP